MKSLKNKLRRLNNRRRQIVIHDFKHLNCYECQEHRVNHYSTFIMNAILITALFTVLMVLGIWLVHGLFIIPLILYWAFIWMVLDWYHFPPHKRRFFNILFKFNRRRRTVD
jgi:accessory gene regulator protein AgrB